MRNFVYAVSLLACIQVIASDLLKHMVNVRPLHVALEDPIAKNSVNVIVLNPDQIKEIAFKIWTNECGRGDEQKLRNLIHWNEHEQHLSVGIMHFTWSCLPIVNEKDRNQFLALARYIRKYSGKKLPFKIKDSCPWKSREQFLQQLNSPLTQQLRNYLLETIPLQAQFLIANRFRQSLKKIYDLVEPASFNHVREQFYRLIQAPGGLFAVLDTLNLSGEKGLSAALLAMSGSGSNKQTIEQFVALRIVRFNYLVGNDPKLNVFLQGWINRVNRYLD